MKIVKLKNKIPKFLIIPLIILIIFSVYYGLNKLEETRVYKSTYHYVDFTKISSDLIHELQKERGYSSGFIASGGKSFSLELKQQREESDKKIKLLKGFLNNFDSSVYSFSFEEPIKKLFLSLNKIDKHRVDIDNNTLKNIQNVTYYTDNIDILLKLIEQVIVLSNDSELIVLKQSYITIMKIKEKAGLERALINRVFSQGRLPNDEFKTFGELVSAQKIYMKIFKRIALQKHIDMLSIMLKSESNIEIIKARNVIYAKNIKNEILSFIKEYVGYGGLIHNFKNYVIRGKSRYANDVKKQYSQLLSAIDKYKAIEGVTKEEIEKLDTIKNVFLKYINALPKITESYQKGGTVTALDKIVKVNDAPATKALRDLTINVYGSEFNWFKHATNRIDVLKNIEDEIAIELHILIDSRSKTLLTLLIYQVIIMIVILILILLLVGMFVELSESEKRLNRAQSSTKSGSYEYHVEENIIIFSDEYYKLLQVNKKSFIPTFESVMKFVYFEDINIVENGFKRAIDLKELISFKYRIVLLDNKEVFVRSTAEVLEYNNKGKPLIIVGTITDISESEKLEQEIIDTQKDVIFTMGSIGESRSKETGNHVRRVAKYSELLYRLCGADRDESELLKMASPMHDIGKVGIPDNILHKQGELTVQEWVIMKTHSEMGYEMLKNSERDILKLAATVALTHHERYDGGGYPKGLVANDIPLVGRITALADVFDALGSDRCYKEAWSLEDILEHIREQRGSQFDPELVDLFLENLDKFLEIRDEYKDKV